MPKYLVQAYSLVEPADEVGFKKEIPRCGNSYSWLITDLKTERGVRNRIKDHVWPWDTSKLVIEVHGDSIHGKAFREIVIPYFNKAVKEPDNHAQIVALAQTIANQAEAIANGSVLKPTAAAGLLLHNATTLKHWLILEELTPR